MMEPRGPLPTSDPYIKEPDRSEPASDKGNSPMTTSYRGRCGPSVLEALRVFQREQARRAAWREWFRTVRPAGKGPQ